MSIERARRDLSIDTIIRKKGSLYTEIFPFLSTSGLPKSVAVFLNAIVETMSQVIPQQVLPNNQILNHPALYRKNKEQTDLEQVLMTRHLEVPRVLQRKEEEMQIGVPH